MKVVLDSWAILRYLEDREPAAPAVSDLLKDQKPIVSWINLGEVFYIIRRRKGEVEAWSTVRDLQEVLTAEVPNSDRILEAARIKADYPMAYADAFAAATAVGQGATLWTGDPELLLPGASWAWRDMRNEAPN